MTKRAMILAASLVVGSWTLVGAEQRAGTRLARSPALSTMDYIEIQQLSRRFMWSLDSGDNYGYAYADLFTADGVFTDGDGKSTTGRDSLAALARGGQRGPLFLSHFGMNHVITPGRDGVVGRAYVAVLDLAQRPHGVTTGGHYDDVYEKTALGWRFKKRTFYPSKVDVWPQ